MPKQKITSRSLLLFSSVFLSPCPAPLSHLHHSRRWSATKKTRPRWDQRQKRLAGLAGLSSGRMKKRQVKVHQVHPLLRFCTLVGCQQGVPSPSGLWSSGPLAILPCCLSPLKPLTQVRHYRHHQEERPHPPARGQGVEAGQVSVSVRNGKQTEK